MKTTRLRAPATAVLWLGLGGCAVAAQRLPPAPVPPVPGDSIQLTLLLVGDAGAPHRGFEPVLAALTADAAVRPERTVVVYLGDNLYPNGLPDSTDPWRPEAERRLDAQVAVLRNSGARGVFVPGNHGWREGWEAVRRQDRFIARAGGGRTALRPTDGCPGPDVYDVDPVLRLVLLDTQWWLERGLKPLHPTSTCPADAKGEITDALRAAVRDAAGRVVVVAAHHPLATGGRHGGYFGWKDHVFPLRHIRSWLWVPLPILGSLYPLARQSGISPQDLSSSAYRELRDSLQSAFADAPPLVYAAGHEHNLQVIEPQRPPYLLVSGSGIFGHVSPVSGIRGTRFAVARSGYMRIDILPDRRARLGVLIVDGTGHATEGFAMWLTGS